MLKKKNNKKQKTFQRFQLFHFQCKLMGKKSLFGLQCVMCDLLDFWKNNGMPGVSSFYGKKVESIDSINIWEQYLSLR